MSHDTIHNMPHDMIHDMYHAMIHDMYHAMIHDISLAMSHDASVQGRIPPEVALRRPGIWIRGLSTHASMIIRLSSIVFIIIHVKIIVPAAREEIDASSDACHSFIFIRLLGRIHSSCHCKTNISTCE